MTMNWAKLAADLERLLKLRNPPFSMKLFERVEDMEAIPRIRRRSRTCGASYASGSPRSAARLCTSYPMSEFAHKAKFEDCVAVRESATGHRVG